jgi:hypothetical protein
LSRSVRAILLAAFLLVPAPPAAADWLITPFIGTTFGGQSAVVQFDSDAVQAKHLLFGASVIWLSDRILGFEADAAFVPGIFEDDNSLNLVESSYGTTLTGSVVTTLPLSITRESLRPYLLGGAGLVRATQEDPACIFECETLSEAALQLGGGVIGFINDRTGLRFDLRQTRTFRRDEGPLGDRRAKLSFWRATAGVVIRY